MSEPFDISPYKIAVCISIYNEAGNIEEVVKDVPEGCDAFVIDDGSRDAGAELSRQLGANVIRHSVNLGQGAAVITGFKAVLLGDYDFIVQIDGDGQHDPRDIPRFIEALLVGESDFVVGSRILGSNYADAPWVRRTFLPWVNSAVNMCTGYKMTDTMCGFRVFRVSAIRRVAECLDEMVEPQYMSAELLMRFSRAGLKVSEIPIDLKDRTTGLSHKGLVRYGWGVGWVILRTLFDRS